jgi:hypothetical protein
MSTTAVATHLVEDRISTVVAAAAAPEAPETTPDEAAPPDEAVTATKQCQLLKSSSEFLEVNLVLHL